MLNHRLRGSTLVEMLIASSIGAFVVLAIQQQLQWQTGVQHLKISRAILLLSAQATANQLFDALQSSAATHVSNPQNGCYLFPQQNGGAIGVRVRNNQLQHNSMTLDCSGYGWQSLTDKSQFKVTRFTAESYASVSPVGGLPKLLITLTVDRRGEDFDFKRLITLSVN
ncbi:prepilin-type N-terminal cleavage/methylation domain-containing protein [Idiomarina sp. HP20-50]|uniref:prepilin-type N-terminal cleavage/methylation domain-containing protein n=1 Tax=Idiomarina sp. HP20-50 TaxID=3070813 RepID=UPI00294AB6C6|nr:prepilin-type N-terminal cleavage/methylation domain-containing protein [Idiomarina sp. HP20-50]MDV6316951.1 prepilin-type N-terminal cleavage/methylation domain-containing protein [Idiomarina sp. HP20-50]